MLSGQNIISLSLCSPENKNFSKKLIANETEESRNIIVHLKKLNFTTEIKKFSPQRVVKRQKNMTNIEAITLKKNFILI